MTVSSGGAGAGGSNPLTPTNYFKHLDEFSNIFIRIFVCFGPHKYLALAPISAVEAPALASTECVGVAQSKSAKMAYLPN